MFTNFHCHVPSIATQHLTKKQSSSSWYFCVILEVSVYSTFFQHLIQYSVIHSLAAATLFLNYLKYFLSLPMKLQRERIWFLTQTKNEIQGSEWIRYEWNKYTKACLTEWSTYSDGYLFIQGHELHPWFSNICSWWTGSTSSQENTVTCPPNHSFVKYLKVLILVMDYGLFQSVEPQMAHAYATKSVEEHSRAAKKWK